MESLQQETQETQEHNPIGQHRSYTAYSEENGKLVPAREPQEQLPRGSEEKLKTAAGSRHGGGPIQQHVSTK